MFLFFFPEFFFSSGSHPEGSRGFLKKKILLVDFFKEKKLFSCVFFLEGFFSRVFFFSVSDFFFQVFFHKFFSFLFHAVVFFSRVLFVF